MLVFLQVTHSKHKLGHGGSLGQPLVFHRAVPSYRASVSAIKCPSVPGKSRRIQLERQHQRLTQRKQSTAFLVLACWDWAALSYLPGILQYIKNISSIKNQKSSELACNFQAWPKQSACNVASCQLYSHCNSSILRAFLCWDTQGERKLGTTHSTAVFHLKQRNPAWFIEVRICFPLRVAIDISFKSDILHLGLFHSKNTAKEGIEPKWQCWIKKRLQCTFPMCKLCLLTASTIY